MMLAKAVYQNLEHRAVAEIVQLVAACLNSYPQRAGLFGWERTRIWRQSRKTVGNCVARAAIGDQRFPIFA